MCFCNSPGEISPRIAFRCVWTAFCSKTSEISRFFWKIWGQFGPTLVCEKSILERDKFVVTFLISFLTRFFFLAFGMTFSHVSYVSELVSHVFSSFSRRLHSLFHLFVLAFALTLHSHCVYVCTVSHANHARSTTKTSNKFVSFCVSRLFFLETQSQTYSWRFLVLFLSILGFSLLFSTNFTMFLPSCFFLL